MKLPFNEIAETLSIISLLNGRGHHRPKHHFTSHKNWINDPCIFTYRNGEYHMTYQYQPSEVVWAMPIVWGSATSSNLIDWKQHDVVIEPGEYYDKYSVFSGSYIPVGYMGYPTAFYTGVNQRRINWQIPYIQGSETQSMVYSTDNLKTWTKVEDANPLLTQPKEDVTGWRDPQVFQSDDFDKLFHVNKTSYEQTWYMTLSGGRPKLGGAIFLYMSHDLVSWERTSFDLLRDHPELPLREYVGLNWERADFFQMPVQNLDIQHSNITQVLEDEKVWVLMFCTEGAKKSIHEGHSGVYFVGHLNTEDADTKGYFKILGSGVLDYGFMYATTSFLDTDHGNPRRLLIGWSNEMRNMEAFKSHIDWAGTFTIPQSIRIVKEDGRYILEREPVHELSLKRQEDNHCISVYDVLLSSQGTYHPNLDLSECRGNTLDIEIELTIPESTDSLAFDLQVLKNLETPEVTTIHYAQQSNRIIIDKSKSTFPHSKDIRRGNEIGELTPTTSTKNSNKLNIRILLDGSILEVFFNSRTVITTRVYPNSIESNAMDFKVLSGAVQVNSFKVWNEFV